VADRLVASLARPGANVTGVTHITPELQGKRVELLRELIPKVSRVAALWNPAYPPARPVWAETQAAAQVLGLALHELTAQRPEDFEGAFTAMARGRAQALVVVPDHMFWRERKRITELAARHRLPAIYEFRDFVDAGGLMSYGTNLSALDRRAAALVEKILKGTKPADLPVERPAKFDLVINLRTAKALGLTIPQSVLLRADEVIE
jgi:putative ABC transport system substrate-binding protein